MAYLRFSTPLGDMLALAEGPALTGLYFVDQQDVPSDTTAAFAESSEQARALLAVVRVQLTEYFAGQRTRFDLPLAPPGSAFQQRVWQAMNRIECGCTLGYRALAEAIGQPGAARAVGGAVGANPLIIVQPCHRVIRADGGLGGFSAGIERKKALLALELHQSPFALAASV